MKVEKQQLVKGAVYRIRLTDGSWTDGKFLYEKAPSSGHFRSNRHFMFENLRTGRTIEIKSVLRVKMTPPWVPGPALTPVAITGNNELCGGCGCDLDGEQHAEDCPSRFTVSV